MREKKYLHLAKLQISRKLASLANLAKLVLTLNDKKMFWRKNL